MLRLVINPTITGTPTWVDGGEGAVQVARVSGSAITATGGSEISATYGEPSSSTQGSEGSARRIGYSIDGVPDELWLCAVPLSVNLDIIGSLKIRELV